MKDRDAALDGPRLCLSVVLPARDEADNLGPLWRRLRPVLDAVGWPYEVIIVDDGSIDATPRAVADLRRADSRVRGLRFESGRGQSAALAAGIRAARGEWILTLDADLQNPPEEIPKLVALAGEADLVYGRRTSRQDRIAKRVASRVGNGARNLLTGQAVADTGCGLKLMRAEAVRTIPFFDGMHRFLPTLFAAHGFRSTEAPVEHGRRHAGRTKYGTLDRAWRGLVDSLGVRWLMSRSLDASRPPREESDR